MIKAVMLFLAGIVLLGALGRIRLPKMRGRDPGPSVEPARKCPSCGAYVIGSGACGTPDCPEART